MGFQSNNVLKKTCHPFMAKVTVAITQTQYNDCIIKKRVTLLCQKIYGNL